MITRCRTLFIPSPYDRSVRRLHLCSPFYAPVMLAERLAPPTEGRSWHNTANGGAFMANEELVTRRAVIEQYVQYDARKKNLAVPRGMNEWDWSSADDLDRRLEAAKFKYGTIAGYTFWKPVELDYRDLSKCAIFNRIFQSLPQVLGQLAGLPQFETWKPDRRTEWLND